MKQLLFCKTQYVLVCGSREVLFDYCKTISNVHFTSSHSSFGRGGSIRNLLAHIANTYEFWIGQQFLKKEIVFTEYNSVTGMDDVVQVFNSIDRMMEEFFSVAENAESEKTNINLEENSPSAFKLFTHVITHEFHHKGQILSLSRHMGYIPVDTDIMR